MPPSRHLTPVATPHKNYYAVHRIAGVIAEIPDGTLYEWPTIRTVQPDFPSADSRRSMRLLEMFVVEEDTVYQWVLGQFDSRFVLRQKGLRTDHAPLCHHCLAGAAAGAPGPPCPAGAAPGAPGPPLPLPAPGPPRPAPLPQLGVVQTVSS